MTHTHIMLDLETWGTEPGCDIRSIGACVFDPVSGWVGGISPTDHSSRSDTFYIATDNPRGKWGTGSSRDRFFPNDRITWKRKYNLSRDSQTVKWWSEQSDEAQAAFENPVDLASGLRRFGAWMDQVTARPVGSDPVTDCRLWAHGSHFDPPILAAAYRACNMPVPWHYRAPRDTRTAFDMAGIDDHSAWLDQHPGPMGVPHHALDDAICQAWAVCDAVARVDERMMWDAENDPDTVRAMSKTIKWGPTE